MSGPIKTSNTCQHKKQALYDEDNDGSGVGCSRVSLEDDKL